MNCINSTREEDEASRGVVFQGVKVTRRGNVTGEHERPIAESNHPSVMSWASEPASHFMPLKKRGGTNAMGVGIGQPVVSHLLSHPT